MKTLFTIAGLCICFSCFSQLSQEKRNEVKLDFLSTLMKYPTISYERFLGRHVGTGLSIGFPWKDPDGINRFLLLPYGRFYFGELSFYNNGWWYSRVKEDIVRYDSDFFLGKLLECFFIEMNTGIFGSEELDETAWRYHNITKFGFGAAVGFKVLGEIDGLERFKSPSFTAEVVLGLGWGFDDFKIAYPRIGISFGYVF